MATKQEREGRRTLVIGEGAFTQGRLMRDLEAGGFQILRELDLDNKYDLALVELPGGPEVALLHSVGTKLVAVMEDEELENRQAVRWPFEEKVSKEMSSEDVLSICNDVLFRDKGVRRHKRHSVSIDVLASGPKRTLRSRIINIGEGGVFVLSLNPFPKGTDVSVRMAGKQGIGDLLGEVVYTIGFSEDSIVRGESPQHRIVARPGMAIRFAEGQEMVVSRWMRHALLQEAEQ